ncbi:MAG: hypothetical protein BGO57_11495 [Sphingomonadales bacterium 63-6]|nr:MAG: hypothetical protein BGO57_11495 [Sphingomonadales bacterium 63-6]
MASSPMISLNALNLQLQAHGYLHEARLISFTAPREARLSGGPMAVIPEQKRARPFHEDHVNEELFAMLSCAEPLRYADAGNYWDDES